MQLVTLPKGNISGPFKKVLRRQETSTESSNKVQGPNFTVTYWLFFPFSEGKDVCVVETGPRLLGPWPLPLLGGHCLGKRRRYGSHLGDWEHLSIQFVNGQPHSLYTSAHKLGAYYKFLNQRNGIFRLYRHELREGGRVEGWLQNPRFPPTVYLTKPLHATPAPRIPNLVKSSGEAESMRPTLFAAKGSHGLWASPGHHQYVRYPPLEDITGYGTPWATWTNLQIIHKTKEKQPICFNKRDVDNNVENNSKEDLPEKYNGERTAPEVEGIMNNENISIEGGCNDGSDWPSWMSYQGHWGEPRKGCHEALSKLGVGGWSCEYSDGPKGIPAKRSHFSCNHF
ncbi:hypothetical protein J437_LFUL004475 [Ladona fulva]|uniref:Uncharacterized protein n=1 Tax=Ladona fulva TaxID=123851 RepID=A0A8K0JZL9_LADFU|nr:hypothetical protein J437_LFUL004475 [Ladona fulva]